MNINEMMPESKYLKKEDVDPAIEVQITGVANENLAKEGEAPDFKWILHFNGPVKPMVLNKTNINMIGHILGPETDNWAGKKITLFNDPTVGFGDKITGGIRVQMPVQTNPGDYMPPDF